MSPGIGVGVGLPFVHLRRRSSSILDQLFGGGQGMYAVAGVRGSVIRETETPAPNSSVWSNANRTTEPDAILGLTASVYSTTVAGTDAGQSGALIHNNDVNFSVVPASGSMVWSLYLDPGSARHWRGVISGGISTSFRIDFDDDSATIAGSNTITVQSVANGFRRIVIVAQPHQQFQFAQLRIAPVATSVGDISIAASDVRVAGFQALGGVTDPITFGSGAPYGAWTDQTGGGRHVTLPGGSADPIQLDHDGTDYFYFPGTTGNYLGVPDAAYLTPATSFRVEKKMRLGDWDSTTAVWTLWDNNNFGSGIGYNLQYNANGLIQLFYGDGSSTQSALSSAAPAFADNADGWIAAEILFDDGGGNHTITFETSTDGASWSTLGVVRTVAGEITGGFDGDTPNIDVANGAASRRIYCTRVVVDGTTVLDVNAADADEDSSTFTEASSNAATVTINRSASGYMTWVVKRPWSIAATDDYMNLGDDDLWDIPDGGDFTAIVVGLQHAPGTNGYLEGAGSSSWTLYDGGGGGALYFYVDSASSGGQQPAAVTPGTKIAAFAGVITASTITTYRRGVAGSNASQSVASTQSGGVALTGLRLLGGYSRFCDAGACAVAITHRALTPEQIDEVRDALLALNSGG